MVAEANGSLLPVGALLGSPQLLHRAATRAAVSRLFSFDTPIPYSALQQMFDESALWGICGREKAVYLRELSDDAIDVIAAHVPNKGLTDDLHVGVRPWGRLRPTR